MKIYRLLKDHQQRYRFYNKEVLKKIFHFLFIYISNNISCIYMILPKLISKHISYGDCKSRIKNYCIISGRSRGVYRDFKISRIQLRSVGSQGYIFGLKKASW